MQDLVNLYYSRYQQQTISSIEIAKNTGQNHDAIIKECDILNSCYKTLALPIIEERIYIVPNSKQQQREFLLTKEQQSHLFIVSIIESLNDDSRQLMEHILNQNKSGVPKMKTQKDAEQKTKGKKPKMEKLPKEPKPKKVRTPKPKNNDRLERGLIPITDVLIGSNINRVGIYTKLLTAKVVESKEYTNPKGVKTSYYSITEEYAHLGVNEKLKGNTEETRPFWFEAKKDEIINIIKSTD